MKYSIIVSTDEETLRNERDDNESSVEFLIEQEAGWMSGSGISAENCLPFPEDTEEDQQFVDQALDQIKKDVEMGDMTAVCELLQFIPLEYIKGYLPE